MRYTVEYSGTIDVDADCALEAECTAAIMCRPDNCRVLFGGDKEEYGGEPSDPEDEAVFD